ncbi:hypothetical protein C8J56DRAFT_911775 [Mycena floridula]|nr:hypothetical protein C8J56DRAFT_911775 [Mycena floridula]
MALSLPLVVLAVLSLSSRASAQLQPATCTNSAFSWAFNSLNQSPCDIATILASRCDSTFYVPALPAGYFYSGNGAAYTTECVCNEVYYTLLSVCGDCQQGFASPWPLWSVNCTEAQTFNTYPGTLPSNTRIPHYAYLPLLANGTVDFTTAQFDIGAETVPAVTTTSRRLGSTSSPDSTNIASHKPTPVGAIVGGVIGGLVLLGLLGVGIFLCLKKRKSGTTAAPSSAYGQGALPGQHPGPISMMNEKQYNPNDPTTFPSGNSAAWTQGPPTVTGSPPPPHSPPGMMAPHQFQGAPPQFAPQPQYIGQQPQFPGQQHPQFQGAPVPQV